MMKHVGNLKLTDITETAPCMLTILMIPFTSSIADGIGCGIILYAILKVVTRQKTNALLLILSAIFIVFFLIS
jgi:adenine/guanine/hypoxanthine permease